MTFKDCAGAHPGQVLAHTQTCAEREAGFADERAAARAEASNPAAIDEDRDWEQTVSNGIN
jgi:hypothetical protein